MEPESKIGTALWILVIVCGVLGLVSFILRAIQKVLTGHTD